MGKILRIGIVVNLKMISQIRKKLSRANRANLMEKKGGNRTMFVYHGIQLLDFFKRMCSYYESF